MTTEQKISVAATRIAGCIFEDSEGTLRNRLDAAINWKNLGTDADLTHEDRFGLEILREYLDGRTLDLIDSDTGEVIRSATLDEAIESAIAGPEGHIDVNDRTCYVA